MGSSSSTDRSSRSGAGAERVGAEGCYRGRRRPVEGHLGDGDALPRVLGHLGQTGLAQPLPQARLVEEPAQGDLQGQRVAGGTSKPASPTTSGSEPLALATTGTPDAWASTATRPNCSIQLGSGTEGTANTSNWG